MRLFAYLDPGTGSLFIQAIIGGLLAGVVVLRSWIRTTSVKIRTVIGRKPAAVDEEV